MFRSRVQLATCVMAPRRGRQMLLFPRHHKTMASPGGAILTPARGFFFSRGSKKESEKSPMSGNSAKEKLSWSAPPAEAEADIPCYEAVQEPAASPASADAPPRHTPSREEMQRLRSEPPVKSKAQEQIEQEIHDIVTKSLKPYDKVFRFTSDVTYTMPMVMLLGNHSSGKSTLINYLCGREIQSTGVAPTDDGFTIIRRGEFDMNDDGPTAVSNPGYQFQALQPFGFNFITRFKVKTRTMPPTSGIPFNMMLVDTPGMIDTPVHVADRTSLQGQLRGYDFLEVTRWFASRSDVILLMFDPANPGTTGETLDVLTRSLQGMEHKFLLVLNKVDVFEKVTDYARAYGALCWNLSKVIKMKDMPPIYNTCTPIAARADLREEIKRRAANNRAEAAGVIGDAEIQRQRSEILEEVFSAPLRRLDNLITETEESAHSLLLACQVSDALKWEFRQREMMLMSGIALFCVSAPAFVFGVSSISLVGAFLSTVASFVVGVVSVVASQHHLREYERSSVNSCDIIFERLVTGRDRTSMVENRWKTIVKPEIVRLVTSNMGERGGRGIAALPSSGTRACRSIQSVIQSELPALRTRVSTFKHEECRQRHESGAAGNAVF